MAAETKATEEQIVIRSMVAADQLTVMQSMRRVGMSVTAIAREFALPKQRISHLLTLAKYKRVARAMARVQEALNV